MNKARRLLNVVEGAIDGTCDKCGKETNQGDLSRYDGICFDCNSDNYPTKPHSKVDDPNVIEVIDLNADNNYEDFLKSLRAVVNKYPDHNIASLFGHKPTGRYTSDDTRHIVVYKGTKSEKDLVGLIFKSKGYRDNDEDHVFITDIKEFPKVNKNIIREDMAQDIPQSVINSYNKLKADYDAMLSHDAQYPGHSLHAEFCAIEDQLRKFKEQYPKIEKYSHSMDPMHHISGDYQEQ